MIAGFLGLILLSQTDLISLHKHATQRFRMNVAVSCLKQRPYCVSNLKILQLLILFRVAVRVSLLVVLEAERLFSLV